MREIHVPLMRRRVRAFRHVTDVAQIALIDDFHVIYFVYAIDFECCRFIDQIKQRRERVAETHTTATTVADVIHPLKFFIERILVPKIRIFPINGVSSGGLQVAFAHDVWGQKNLKGERR